MPPAQPGCHDARVAADDAGGPVSLLLPALVGLSLLATAGWFLASYRADAEDRRDAARPAATTTTIAPTSTTVPGPEVGVFDPAPGTSPGAGRGSVTTYTVEVEQIADLDPARIGDQVDAVLADPRGWTVQNRSVQRIPEGGQVTITLATAATTADLCADAEADSAPACFDGDRIVIDTTTWRSPPSTWPLGRDGYRAFVVNHGFGHALGAPDAGCPGPGEVAPIMLQQTVDLAGCTANPWPFPTVA